MGKIQAYSNHDIALINWYYEEKIPGCLGFAVYRTDVKTKKETPLPAWVGFEDQSNEKWEPKTTEVWPIQKFSWNDLTAERGKTYTYKVVPMIGTENNLVAGNPNDVLISNPVSLSPDCNGIEAYFNRGILSTQYLAHQLPKYNGTPDYKTLMDRIDQPGDTLRNKLGGELLVAMKAFLNDGLANKDITFYCALYEFTDPELQQIMLANPKRFKVILSNTGTDDKENHPTRQSLHDAGIEIYDRMVGGGHIGHNKFVVAVEKNKPKIVLSGSTNWTDTGICAQSNNLIILTSEELATMYLDYWKRLKADGSSQGRALRTADNAVNEIKLNGADIDVWFSPNTKLKSKPSVDPPTPGDMQEVFNLMNGATKGILFLVFQPGSPSILDEAMKIEAANPGLFIRGAATDAGAVNDYHVQLFHRGINDYDTVVAASAVNDQFAYWQKELLKASPGAHAIIHDKIIVIDPFTEDCVVITGSHNQGYRASYNNDENMLIIKGNPKLAEAYTTHVLDVYDHYRWRYILEQHKDDLSKAFHGLKGNDSWQDYYFKPGTAYNRSLTFWFDNKPAGGVLARAAVAKPQGAANKPLPAEKAGKEKPQPVKRK